ncbi:hypothetical protein [Streptomyces sp. NRRL S-15]|nr:hypothetical protein [Streptomyces sp. NRRL S-15]
MLKAAKEVLEDLAKPKGLGGVLTSAATAVGKGVGLVLSFDVKTVLNINTGRLNAIVDKYTGILESLTTRMEALKPPGRGIPERPEVRGRCRPCTRLRHPGP